MDPQHPHKQSLAAYFCNHSAGCEARVGGAWGLVSQMASVVSSRLSEKPCLRNKVESGRGIYVMDSRPPQVPTHAHHTYVCMHTHIYVCTYIPTNLYIRTYIQHSVKYSGNSEHRQMMQEHSEQSAHKATVQLLGRPLSSQLSSSFQSRGSGWDRDVTN